MKSLRLLLFEECNRNCGGCCNKGFALEQLEVCRDFTGYDEIILTGGEPMLLPELVKQVVTQIREQDDDVPIYVYTAMPNRDALDLLDYVDGLTVTLHSQSDVDMFLLFDTAAQDKFNTHLLSMRLNIFNNVNIDMTKVSAKWIVKPNIEWIVDCPLPTNESFMRIDRNDFSCLQRDVPRSHPYWRKKVQETHETSIHAH